MSKMALPWLKQSTDKLAEHFKSSPQEELVWSFPVDFGTNIN